MPQCTVMNALISELLSTSVPENVFWISLACRIRRPPPPPTSSLQTSSLFLCWLSEIEDWLQNQPSLRSFLKISTPPLLLVRAPATDIRSLLLLVVRTAQANEQSVTF